MSDARSDIMRDFEIEKRKETIKNLEDKFKSKPSIDLAEEIIEEIERYSNLNRGYFMNVNKKDTEFKKRMYKRYISKNQQD